MNRDKLSRRTVRAAMIVAKYAHLHEHRQSPYRVREVMTGRTYPAITREHARTVRREQVSKRAVIERRMGDGSYVEVR